MNPPIPTTDPMIHSATGSTLHLLIFFAALKIQSKPWKLQRRITRPFSNFAFETEHFNDRKSKK
jgi:hypothetical protein